MCKAVYPTKTAIVISCVVQFYLNKVEWKEQKKEHFKMKAKPNANRQRERFGIAWGGKYYLFSHNTQQAQRRCGTELKEPLYHFIWMRLNTCKKNMFECDPNQSRSHTKSNRINACYKTHTSINAAAAAASVAHAIARWNFMMLIYLCIYFVVDVNGG